MIVRGLHTRYQRPSTAIGIYWLSIFKGWVMASLPLCDRSRSAGRQAGGGDESGKFHDKLLGYLTRWHSSKQPSFEEKNSKYATFPAQLVL